MNTSIRKTITLIIILIINSLCFVESLGGIGSMRGRAGNPGIVKHRSKNNYHRSDIYYESSKIPTMDIDYFYAILIPILIFFVFVYIKVMGLICRKLKYSY
jgi:hypothetical protein